MSDDAPSIDNLPPTIDQGQRHAGHGAASSTPQEGIILQVPFFPAASPTSTWILAVVLAMLAGVPVSMAAAAPRGWGLSASAQVTVTGRLVPGACTVHLAGHGMIEYGDVPRKRVPDGSPLALGIRDIQFTVSCEDAMVIKVSARDEKAGTAILGLVPGEDKFAFGLGSVNDTNIGQFRIKAVPGTFFAQDAQGHSAPVDILYAYVDHPAWRRSENPYFWANGDTRQSFAAPGTLDPGAYRSVTGAFRIETYINRRSRLPGGRVPLAGLATIEIFY